MVHSPKPRWVPVDAAGACGQQVAALIDPLDGGEVLNKRPVALARARQSTSSLRARRWRSRVARIRVWKILVLWLAASRSIR
ncbi:MAG: hypothetical protein AAFU49_16340, partial [Pseudomonadota bacterium]